MSESTSMRAIIQERYGAPEAVLRLGELERPSPADDAVLVRVMAASVNSGDWRRVTADPPIVRVSEGLRRPKSPQVGGDAAGVVEAVGKDVTGLRVGDEVYGMRQGAFAEYVAGRSFVPKPATLSFAEAAAVPAAGVTALQALRDRGGLKPGERVLVNGAGGGVGTFTVQIARGLGAAHVTAVTRTDCLDAVRAIGADDVVDYTREDFTRRAEQYDLIVDCAGKPSVRAFSRVLAPGGRLVLVGAGRGSFGVLGRLVGSQLRRRVLRQPVINFIASPPFQENLLALRELIDAGKVRPVIERTYPLSEVPAAVAYARTERICGKIVIAVA